jgi:hypothetical protein
MGADALIQALHGASQDCIDAQRLAGGYRIGAGSIELSYGGRRSHGQVREHTELGDQGVRHSQAGMKVVASSGQVLKWQNGDRLPLRRHLTSPLRGRINKDHEEEKG